jgi:choline dehydrogenase-like flavoprotein
VADRCYDYIIIGSGAGGGPLARWLTAAGRSVLMIEAGSRFRSGEYPDNELYANSRLMWGGGMDTSRDAGYMFLRGKVFGGGTVINQALLDRFDASALDSWAERSGLDAFSVDAMARHYDAVENELALEEIPPSARNGNAQLYIDGFDRLGYGWAPLRRGQSDCRVEQGNDCIRCLGGCPRASKQSMPVSFLRQAEASGLEVVTDCPVEGLYHGHRMVTVHGRQNGEPRRFFGRHCVLAAGALGSTNLLQASGLHAQLPALGEGFYCHPQFVTLGLYDQAIDAHKGSFQAVKSDDARFRRAGFKLENVFMGPAGAAYLMPGFGARHRDWMRAYRHLACIEVAVRDVTPGRIGVDAAGRPRIDKQTGRPERERARAGLKVIEDIYKATGARKVIRSPVRIGLHLMGGCAQGLDRSSSVVNPDFQVHGLPRLHVVDGSLFPDAPGINPSLSIMALAHRAAERILGETINATEAAA